MCSRIPRWREEGRGADKCLEGDIYTEEFKGRDEQEQIRAARSGREKQIKTH